VDKVKVEAKVNVCAHGRSQQMFWQKNMPCIANEGEKCTRRLS